MKKTYLLLLISAMILFTVSCGKEKLDKPASFVPADARGYGVVDVSAIKGSALYDVFKTKIEDAMKQPGAKAIQEKSGMSPDDIDSIVFGLTDLKALNRGPGGLVASINGSFDAEKAVKAMAEEQKVEMVDIGGKKGIKDSARGMSVVAYTGNSILLGGSENVNSAIKTAKGETDNISKNKKLAEVAGLVDSDAAIFLVSEIPGDVAEQGARQIPALSKARTMALSASAGKSVDLTLAFKGGSEEDAKKGAENLNKMIPTFKKLTSRLGPIKASADKVLDSFKAEAKGNAVVLSLTVEEDAIKAIASVATR